MKKIILLAAILLLRNSYHFHFLGFTKMVMVMHPFLRLANSYQKLYKSDGNQDKELLDTKTKIAQFIQRINDKPSKGSPSFKVCLIDYKHFCK